MVGVDSKRRTARRMESGISRGIYVNKARPNDRTNFSAKVSPLVRSDRTSSPTVSTGTTTSMPELTHVRLDITDATPVDFTRSAKFSPFNAKQDTYKKNA
jgi:hypothetical protein